MALPKPSPPGRAKRATSAGSPSESRRASKGITPSESKRASRTGSTPEPKTVEASAEPVPEVKRTAVKRGRIVKAEAKPKEQLAAAAEIGGDETPEEGRSESPAPEPSKRARVAVAKPKRGVVKAAAAPLKTKASAKPAGARGRRAAAPRPAVRRPQRAVAGAAQGGRRPVMAPVGTDVNNNEIDEGMLMAPGVDDDSNDEPSDHDSPSPPPGPSRGRGRGRSPLKKQGTCAASSPARKCGSFVERMSQPKYTPAVKKYEPLAHRTSRSVVKKTSPCTPKRDAKPSRYGEKPLSGPQLESFLTRMSTPRHVTPKAKSDEDSPAKKPWF